MHSSMRLTWEKIKRSLGIPDKLTDAEMADEIAGREVERLKEGGEAGVLTSTQIVDRPGESRPPRDTRGREGSGDWEAGTSSDRQPAPGRQPGLDEDSFRPATGATGPPGTTGGQGSGPPSARADGQTSPEFTGRGQPQIESGPWGDLAVQDGPRQYSGIPDQVTDDALYSGIDAGGTQGIDPDEARRGRGMSADLGNIGHGEAGLRATPRATGGLRFSGPNGASPNGQANPGGDAEGTRGHQGADFMANDWQQREDDGVHVTPTPITLGETVHVKYNGPLAQSGSSVHLHWGFGPGQWTHVQDQSMEREADGYTATLNVDKDGRFEFCFHDNEGNWDNNEGRNWSYIIHDGELPGKYVVDRD